jgi:hypothetical protein
MPRLFSSCTVVTDRDRFFEKVLDIEGRNWFFEMIFTSEVEIRFLLDAFRLMRSKIGFGMA